MRGRRAPETGYDFGNKRQYRRDLWGAFRRMAGPSLRDYDACIMPSLEGDEIDVALAAGCDESQLCIVDRNPAIVATLKRRFPRVQTFGCDVAAAAARFRRPVGIANLDLTSPVSQGMVETISTFFATVPLPERGIIAAVSMLRGREMPDITGLLQQWEETPRACALVRAAIRRTHGVTLTPRDYARVAVVLSAVEHAGRSLVPVLSEVYAYKSHKVSMLVALFGAAPIGVWRGLIQDALRRGDADPFDVLLGAMYRVGGFCRELDEDLAGEIRFRCGNDSLRMTREWGRIRAIEAGHGPDTALVTPVDALTFAARYGRQAGHA